MGPIDLLHTAIPSPAVFQFGGFGLRWYGLLFSSGAIIGYFFARREWRERGWQLLELEQLVALLIFGGLLGARLFDVFVFEWWYFKDHLGEILSVWRGGLAFHGGLLAATGVLIWWCKKNKRSWLMVADTLAPALALAQAIGRWGNYANQELFGLPTQLPWGIPIAVNYRPILYISATHFHPVFIYESLALIIIAVLLVILRKRFSGAGHRFAAYLILTGVVRFALEFLRIDEQVELWGIRVGSVVAIVAVAVGVWLWIKSRKLISK